MSARVLVSIVTYNSSSHLKACLESLKTQTYRDFSLSIWDNASTDATKTIIESYRSLFDSVVFSDHNLGFCAAHNRLITPKNQDYVLVLNPDVVLDPCFIEILTSQMDRDSSAGSATGKLLRWQAQTSDPVRQKADAEILDTTGIYITPAQRHFDRGASEIDTGQYERLEYVFGASGAAAFYRQAMLEDIRQGNEYFDESFFAFREDADLAWRAQWMGWHCLYVPKARGYHVRRVLPERRSILPDAINMHSFKNRFLMRIKNMDLGTYIRFFGPISLRDAAAVAYVLVREWSSLPGIPLLIKTFPRTWALRRSLKARRRVSPKELRSWFSHIPVAKS
jgi:GT2 family glycosyltransferase